MTSRIGFLLYVLISPLRVLFLLTVISQAKLINLPLGYLMNLGIQNQGPTTFYFHFPNSVTSIFDNRVSEAPRRPASGEWTCSKALPLWTSSQPHQNIPVLHFSRRGGPLTLPAFAILVFMTLNPKLAGGCKTKHPNLFFREEGNLRKRE